MGDCERQTSRIGLSLTGLNFLEPVLKDVDTRARPGEEGEGTSIPCYVV